MAFVVDVVSEDSFYENLCLGLTKLLENTPGVQDIELEKRLPCERLLISSWEQRYACTLPEDLRQFYSSTDGFKLIWNYDYAGEILPIGNLRINSISELRRIAGNKIGGDPDCPTILDIDICNQFDPEVPKPTFGTKCKIFELDPCQNIAKVCLVYMDRSEGDAKKEEPKIWLLDRCYEWHVLADSFTQYFRMMLVHQGLPQWQYRFTQMGLTPWAEQIMYLISPHLLNDRKVKSPEPDWGSSSQNQLDPSIFKTKSKNLKSKKCEK